MLGSIESNKNTKKRGQTMHVKLLPHHKNILQQLIEQCAAYTTLSRELSDIAEVDRRTVTGTPKIERYATAEVADILRGSEELESVSEIVYDILHGNYNVGATWRACRALKARANANTTAQLTQLALNVAHGIGNAQTSAAWKLLAEEERDALDASVAAAVESFFEWCEE